MATEAERREEGGGLTSPPPLSEGRMQQFDLFEENIYTRESAEEGGRAPERRLVMIEKTEPPAKDPKNPKTAKVLGYRVAVKLLLSGLLELADTGEISPSVRERLEEALRVA